MENCAGGELMKSVQNVKKYSEDEAKLIMIQLMKSICYLHSIKICHRDLKLENLMYMSKSNNFIKLIDFGISKLFYDQNDTNKTMKMKTQQGTLLYMPPDIMEGFYDELVDIWSAGVILFILLTGYPPFIENDIDSLVNNIKTLKYSLNDNWGTLSDDAKDLIRNMICKRKDRLTANQILQHPWLYKVNLNNKMEIKMQDVNNFYNGSKLRRTIKRTVASQLSESYFNDLANIFVDLDVKHNGLISFDDLFKNVNHTDSERNIFDELTKSNPNIPKKIQYNEFIAIFMSGESIPQFKTIIDNSFKNIEFSKGDFISKDEMKLFINNLSQSSQLNESIENEIHNFLNDLNKVDNIKISELKKIILS